MQQLLESEYLNYFLKISLITWRNNANWYALFFPNTTINNIKYKIYILISNSETAVANDADAKTVSWNSDINTTITDDSENNVKGILTCQKRIC